MWLPIVKLQWMRVACTYLKLSISELYSVVVDIDFAVASDSDFPLVRLISISYAL